MFTWLTRILKIESMKQTIFWLVFKRSTILVKCQTNHIIFKFNSVQNYNNGNQLTFLPKLKPSSSKIESNWIFSWRLGIRKKHANYYVLTHGWLLQDYGKVLCGSFKSKGASRERPTRILEANRRPSVGVHKPKKVSIWVVQFSKLSFVWKGDSIDRQHPLFTYPSFQWGPP